MSRVESPKLELHTAPGIIAIRSSLDINLDLTVDVESELVIKFMLDRGPFQ